MLKSIVNCKDLGLPSNTIFCETNIGEIYAFRNYEKHNEMRYEF